MSVLPVGFGDGLVPSYEIEKSLRFRASASARLERTMPTSGNNTLWTYSDWIKRGSLDTQQYIIGASDGASFFLVYFNASNQISIDQFNSGIGVTINKTTTAVFRDPSAYLHIHLVYDSNNAAAEDRVILRVNNARVTSFSPNTNPSLGRGCFWNFSGVHTIGRNPTALSDFFDGYHSEINFIDSQALAATEFGETDPVTGVWVPKEYTGAYGGNNSFYLPFNDGTSLTTLTEDRSGNGNNWTANNISLTAGVNYDWMDDTPTNNYPVCNPLARWFNATTHSNANLTISGTMSVYSGTIHLPSTGKWYCEMTCGVITSEITLGISNYSPARTAEISYQNNGNKNTTAGPSAYGATYTNGDVIGMAVDCDSAEVTFYKNNVSQGALLFSLSSLVSTNLMIQGYVNLGTGNLNFGQRPFAYTPPTGFLPLNTANAAPITPISSGSFTGNANVNGPFVWLAGTPDSMTINGNAVTFGTHADRLANGIKLRTNSASYNAAGANTFSVASFVDDFTDPNRAKANP
jgi:hypothetical protein